MTPSGEELLDEVDIDSVTFFQGLSLEKTEDEDEDIDTVEPAVSKKPKQVKRHILSFWKIADKGKQRQKA